MKKLFVLTFIIFYALYPSHGRNPFCYANKSKVIAEGSMDGKKITLVYDAEKKINVIQKEK